MFIFPSILNSFASARHCLLPTAISYCILRFVHNLNCLSWQLTSCRHIALENLISRVLNVVPFSSFSRLRTEFYLNFMVWSSWQGDTLCTQWVLMVLSWLGRLILAKERSLLFFTFLFIFKNCILCNVTWISVRSLHYVLECVTILQYTCWVIYLLHKLESQLEWLMLVAWFLIIWLNV